MHQPVFCDTPFPPLSATVSSFVAFSQGQALSVLGPPNCV